MAYSTLLYHSSPTSGAFDLSSFDLSSQKIAFVNFQNVTMSNSGASLFARFYVNGAIQSSGYLNFSASNNVAGSSVTEVSGTANMMTMNDPAAGWGMSNSLGAAFCGNIFILGANAPSPIRRSFLGHEVHRNPGGDGSLTKIGNACVTSGTITGLYIYANSGTITGGKVALFGYKVYELIATEADVNISTESDEDLMT